MYTRNNILFYKFHTGVQIFVVCKHANMYMCNSKLCYIIDIMQWWVTARLFANFTTLGTSPQNLFIENVAFHKFWKFSKWLEVSLRENWCKFYFKISLLIGNKQVYKTKQLKTIKYLKIEYFLIEHQKIIIFNFFSRK